MGDLSSKMKTASPKSTKGQTNNSPPVLVCFIKRRYPPSIMKTILQFLFCFSICHSADLGPSPATEFIAGKVSKFSTKAHPKAKGAVFSINYPTSWAAKEGVRPNIVQMFVSESGKGLENITIVTTSLGPGPPIGESELKEALSPDGLKSLVPDNGKFIRGTSTKIEGVPAGILEYSIRETRAGLEVDMHITMINFLQGNTAVQVQCAVGVLSSKASELAPRVAAFRPLFQLVMNSIVFDDKWK